MTSQDSHNQYRHKTTGTIYTSADFGHGGMVKVTTLAGSKYIVHAKNIQRIKMTDSHNPTLYMTDYDDLDIAIAEALNITLPDPDKSLLDAGGCLCKRIKKSEGWACGNHAADFHKVSQVRTLILAHSLQERLRGGIDALSNFRDHDLPTIVHNLVIDDIGNLKRELKELEYGTAR